MTTDVQDPYATGDVVNADGTVPRDLNELLKLDSYQGMTDDEIKLVMAWKETMAYRNAANDAAREELSTAYAAMVEKLDAAARLAQESFERACSIAPAFQRIEDGDAS